MDKPEMGGAVPSAPAASEPMFRTMRQVRRSRQVKAEGPALNASIAKAWARCRDEYKLDPAAEPLREHVGASALKRRIDGIAAFQRISTAEMQRLFGQIAQSSHVLVLADASGVVLDVLSAPGHADMLGRLGLAPGFVWDEQHEGANGPGTCLHDRQPVLVHRDDHYFLQNRGMTCSAVPIWRANGNLAGVLDVSCLGNGDSRESHLPMLALAGISARIIEHLHFLDGFRNCTILRLHQQRELAGLPCDSLLAINDDGNIAAADSTIPALFGCVTHQEVIGRGVEDLLGLPLDRFLAHAADKPSESLVVPAPARAGGTSSPLYARLWPSQAFRKSRTNQVVKRSAADARHRLLDAARSEDPMMARNIWCLQKVIDKDIHILLQGETGTGKDSFAKLIHQASARHAKPFVAVSCAAIPETLIESELFGYESGAFTGARGGGRRGKILSADGGTLFLDEIGDMPLAAQARLLRVLEEKQVSPLGSDRTITVDSRIISATHRDLPAMVERGEFRMDLYYRLNGLTLHMPSLRDRTDRGGLINRIATEENGGADVAFEEAAWHTLLAHRWPGNIRELRNVLRMAVALADGCAIGLMHLPSVFQKGAAMASPSLVKSNNNTKLSDHRGCDEKTHLMQTLAKHHWRINATAAALGMSRNTLYRKLHAHCLMAKDKPN